METVALRGLHESHNSVLCPVSAIIISINPAVDHHLTSLRRRSALSSTGLKTPTLLGPATQSPELADGPPALPSTFQLLTSFDQGNSLRPGDAHTEVDKFGACDEDDGEPRSWKRNNPSDVSVVQE